MLVQILKRISLSLLLAAALHAQTKVDLTKQVHATEYTIATLPVAPPLGTLATVTDGNGTDCIAGGGIAREFCQYDGGWKPMQNSGISTIGYDAQLSGVLSGDGKYATDATTNIGSPDVSSTAQQTCSLSDIGQRIFALPSGGGAYSLGSTIKLPTVLSCTSPTTWHTDTNASANIVGTGQLLIAHLQTAQLKAARLAAIAANKTLRIPCGIFLIDSPPFLYGPATVPANQAFGISGCNETGTWFVTAPTFDYATFGAYFFFNLNTINYITPATPVQFQQEVLEQFAVTNLNGNIPGPANKTAIAVPALWRIRDVDFTGFIGSANIQSLVHGPDEGTLDHVNIQWCQCSGAGCLQIGTFETVIGPIMAFNIGPVALVTTSGRHATWLGGLVEGLSSAATPINVVGGDLAIYGLQIFGGGATNAYIQVDGTSKVTVNSSSFNCGGDVCEKVLAGGELHNQDVNFSGSTGVIINNAGTVISGGGNRGYSAGTITNTGNWIVQNGNQTRGSCTGVVGAGGGTFGLYGTGANVVLTTCTSALVGTGNIAPAGTLQHLFVTATAAGNNAGTSGVFTVLVNGAASTITCTVGTGTSCSDTTHAVTLSAGNLVSLQFSSPAGDTLAGLNSSVDIN
jgi:hypothetical protein